ncbi:MAG: toll/interleukin-1 receptor domain-containing protein, partial [Bacteroidales bacterium]|nr:toll/interleukin-1 receptor domain-containing protein [Bacteroidales bacterium]
MKNEPNYINPKNPVYISYAWIEDDNDVLEICRVMLENGIDYRRDKDGLCLYKKNIAEVEKKIGDGDAVVVIVSRKYMTSLHTMNEWHNILFKGDIGRRVFVVVLEDAEISNYDKVQECRGILDEEFKKLDARYQTCVKNHQIPSRHLSEVELSAQSNLGFVDDLDYLYAFCRNYNRGSKIEVHRANGFKEIIEPLKKYVTELAEAANAKETIEELKAQIAKLQQGSGAANN